MKTYRGSILSSGISLVGLLALSGCGGGGGGGDGAVGGGGGGGDGAVVAAPAATTVSGAAAKGLVRQATVLVCRIVNGSVEADPACASATSADDGTFKATLSDGYTGPAMIKVLAGSATMMQDETTGSAIPYGMTMRAVVPAVTATTTVYVTPFSEMAAHAVGTSGIDADRMRQAMATAQNTMTSLGIDLTVKPMVDLRNNGSDPVMLGKQFNMIKQLARVMMAAKNSSALTDASGTPCNAAGTSATQQVSCAMNAMAGVMTGVATTDQPKATVVLNALNSQNVTATYTPMLKADGSLTMEMVDMSSSVSMQNGMQRAGMSATVAGPTMTTVMPSMH